MNKEEILNSLKEHKDDYLNRFGIISIGLFGSYARDEATKTSDIDIAIEIDSKKKSLHTFLSFKRELESIFGKKIDLGIESSLKPIVKQYISKDIIYV